MVGVGARVALDADVEHLLDVVKMASEGVAVHGFAATLFGANPAVVDLLERDVARAVYRVNEPAELERPLVKPMPA